MNVLCTKVYEFLQKLVNEWNKLLLIILFYLLKIISVFFSFIVIFFLKFDYREVNDENVLCRDLSFPYNSDMITLQVKLYKREQVLFLSIS